MREDTTGATAPVIVVHGGAGVWRDELTPEREMESRQVVKEALAQGYHCLEQGGPSAEAVELAIRVLEDSPLFNAGRGAVLTTEGTVELDAAIMEGATRRAGAVAAVRRIRNPISAARCVMERSPHVLMVGEGAEEFVKCCNMELVSPRHFVTAERKQQLQRVQDEERRRADALAEPSAHDMIGTVGAVALDNRGNLAAGTSTGGMVNKRFGRVGDTPIIGGGTYADNRTCAVSATGHGEYFIRTVAAHQVSMRMLYERLDLAAATQAVLQDIADLGGTGGLIAVDRSGVVAMRFNTDGMFRGVMKGEGVEVAVF